MKINWQSGRSKTTAVLFSKIWASLLGVLLVPVYVKIIGPESYGLVAFYGTLYGALVLLDAGLTTSVSRQTAVLRAQNGKENDLKDLVFSVEVLNWLIALLGGILVVFLSKPIALYWIKADNLSIHSIRQSVMLMGILFVFQFPISVYEGVITGAQHQLANAVQNFVFITIKAIGVILVLKWISPTIESYFIWQVIITFLYGLSMRLYVAKKILTAKRKAFFSTVQLGTIKKFALGTLGVSLASFCLTQMDKIVVSKYVTLDYVGYYNLAFLVAGAINIFTFSMQPIIMPRMVQLHTVGNHEQLSAYYHKSSKWLSIIVVPIGFFLIFFSKQILMLWTGNEILAASTSPVLRFVIGGTIISSLLFISYYLIQAKGNTRFHLYQYIISAVVFLPFLIWITKEKGIVGASMVWFGLCVGYLFISLPLFHYFFLKGELLKWVKEDIGLPIITAIMLSVFEKYVFIHFITELSLFSLAGLFVVYVVSYSFLIPDLRSIILSGKNINYLK